MANTNVLVLDDGTREIAVTNTFGDPICTIRYRPGDYSIIERAQKLKEAIPEIIAPLDGIEMEVEGKPSDSNDLEVVQEVTKRMLGELCRIFDSEDIAKIFEYRSPFAHVNGQLFFTEVLNKLVERTVEELEKQPKMNSKMDKYLKTAGERNARKSSRKA